MYLNEFYESGHFFVHSRLGFSWEGGYKYKCSRFPHITKPVVSDIHVWMRRDTVNTNISYCCPACNSTSYKYVQLLILRWREFTIPSVLFCRHVLLTAVYNCIYVRGRIMKHTTHAENVASHEQAKL